MTTLIKTRIIRIGNSQGIRLPKLLLQQVGLLGEVEVEAQSGQLIVRPATNRRRGWEEQFRQMASAQDERLLDDEPLTLTTWDASEWAW